MRLLIVEDEYGLADAMERRLKEEGYAVDVAFDGKEAVDFACAAEYDVIILDLMLPVKDGLEVLQELRKKGIKSQIIVLTAKDTTADKIAGLDLGADDYMTKPFSFDELLARIRATLRQKMKSRNSILKVGDLQMDTATQNVTRGGKTIFLSSKEYALLEYLMRNPGSVLSRSQIEEHVWDFSFGGGSNIVDVYIRYLRRKIDQDFNLKLIETIRGRGYRLLKVPENE